MNFKIIDGQAVHLYKSYQDFNRISPKNTSKYNTLFKRKINRGFISLIEVVVFLISKSEKTSWTFDSSCTNVPFYIRMAKHCTLSAQIFTIILLISMTSQSPWSSWIYFTSHISTFLPVSVLISHFVEDRRRLTFRSIRPHFLRVLTKFTSVQSFTGK